MKDARTLTDKVLARLPGYDTLAKQFGFPPVPIRRDMYGQPVPIPSMRPTPEQDMFLEGINAIGVTVPPPPRLYHGVPLTDADYDHLQIDVGNRIKDLSEQKAIVEMLHTPTIPDQLKVELVSARIREARAAGTKVWESKHRVTVSSAKERHATRFNLSVE